MLTSGLILPTSSPTLTHAATNSPLRINHHNGQGGSRKDRSDRRYQPRPRTLNHPPRNPRWKNPSRRRDASHRSEAKPMHYTPTYIYNMAGTYTHVSWMWMLSGCSLTSWRISAHSFALRRWRALTKTISVLSFVNAHSRRWTLTLVAGI